MAIIHLKFSICPECTFLTYIPAHPKKQLYEYTGIIANSFCKIAICRLCAIPYLCIKVIHSTFASAELE